MHADEVGSGALRGLAWTAAEQWGAQLVGLVTFLFLARLLAPSDFGIIAMAGVVTAFLQAAVEQGFSDALVQRRTVTAELLDTAFWSTLGFGLAAAAAVALSAGWIALLFTEPALTVIVAVLGLTLPLTAVGATHMALLRRRLDFSPIAKRGLYAHLFGGAVAILIALSGGGPWSLVAQALITSGTSSLLLWRAVLWRPRWRYDTREFRKLSRFGRSLIAANMVNFANRYADDLVIGLVLGPVALGYYTVAYRLLTSSTRLLAGVASAVAFPAFSRLQQEPERLRAAFYNAVRVAAVVSFPLFAGMAVVAGDLLVTLFGTAWSPAVPVFRVLVLIGLLHSVFYLNTSVLTAAGRPDWVLKLNAVYAVLNVVAFYIAVRWGILAVAAAYVLRGYVTAPLPLAVLRRVIGLDLTTYARQLVGPAAGAVAMAMVVLAMGGVLELEGAAYLVSAGLLGLVSYSALLFLFDRGATVLVLEGVRDTARTAPAPRNDRARRSRGDA